MSGAAQSPGAVVMAAHLKKLKTLKKKYFVLRAEAPGHPACLEYYDRKRKYESKQPPKRSISVRSCFNINKRRDTKHKYVIALYTKDDCFCLVLDNEKELESWLNALLLLQNGDQPDGEQPRPTFEHIWQVMMQKKGLGERKNIFGPYRLCLTDRTLSLVKLGTDDKSDSIEFSLSCIRRSGCMDRIFYMEVGRSAVTGGGEFWMEVEDNNIAQNMHHAINNAMTNSNSAKDEGPRQRMRSSSANEASKPISVLQRRHTAQKLHSFSPLEEQRMHEEQVGPLEEQNITASAPSQCSQSQTTSTSNSHTAAAGVTESRTMETVECTVNSTKSSAVLTNRRRHSVASHPIPYSTNNMSQSTHVNTTSTSSTSTSTTATISHQRTLSLPLAAVAINQSQSSKRSAIRCGPAVRDRCDSLPSRARTTSECQPSTTSGASVSTTAAAAAAQQLSRGALLAPHQVPRPLSMHSRVVSYSPPVSAMPISPASVACSTDSAGSSLSMDDTSENMEEAAIAKYGHSLTPDEPVILEENGDDYVPWPTAAAPHQHKYSPNLKSCSPSQQSSYVEMYSPCSSSPGRGAYMPMSPATGIHSHSRASSLVEENSTLTDGYVPMAPVGDDGYVDMDPANNHNGHFPDDMSQHGGSSCSVTSGTPSTDLRFSEYHLDKVTSFLVPGEDLQARPTRAYSVGSRPEPARQRKNRLDVAQQEASRVRAFSVGSRSKRPEIGRLANIVTAPLVSGIESSHSNKSSSAPLLSSSWGHNSGCSVTSDRMEDLMELDFTRPNAPGVLPSPPSSYSQSQSQSFSTAIDTSSYVDMSPGQPPVSTTASYVDMNGPVKNRNNNNSNNNNNINNNNNNNNITTANHNHNNHSTVMVSTHKPVITQVSSMLKSVDESSYMRMSRPLDDWSQPRISPKQVPSPCQEEYMEMNGPPGGTRTAPMDLPQPRRQPEGYVEMSFKTKPSLEQDYINMSMGLGRNYRRHHSSSNRKKKCSMPIAIQAGSKFSKTPNFLPLNGSPSSESLASTPASPPRATPTGSSATIFPFSLNSPQSPIKPLTATQADSEKYFSIATATSAKTETTSVPLLTRKMSAPSPLPGVDGCPSSKKAHDNPASSVTRNFATTYKSSNLASKEQDMEIELEKQHDSKMELEKEKKKAKSQDREMEQEKKECEKEKGREKYKEDEDKLKWKEKQKVKEREREDEKECSRSVYNSSSLQKPIGTSLIPITKKFSDLSVSFDTVPSRFPRLVTASPMVSPTPTGFKPVNIPKPTSPKVGDDATPTPTPTPTPTSTPTPTPSPLDCEGYEKLQPGDPAIHYASLDLPEVAPLPPQSPVSEKDGFTYAEIDFAKLK